MKDLITTLKFHINKYEINLEQSVKSIEQSYFLLKMNETFMQYIPSLYEIQKYMIFIFNK